MTAETAILITLLALTLVCLLTLWDRVVATSSMLLIRILLEPLRDLTLGASMLSPVKIVGGVIIVYSLVLVFFDKRATFNAPLVRVYYVFLALSLLSFYNVADKTLYISHLFKYTAMASLFLIPYNSIHDLSTGLKQLRYFVYIALVPLLYGFYQQIAQKGLHDEVHIGVTFHRIMATFSHPNGFAFYMGLVALSIVTLIHQGGVKRLFYYGMFPLTILSILFSFSRSVWLTLTVTAMIALFTIKRARIPIILTTMLLCLAFTPHITKRFDDIVNAEGGSAIGEGSSLAFRIDMTVRLFKYAFPQHPLVGFGLGSAIPVAAKYARMDTPPHNEYMRALIETGILGLFAFLFFIMACYLFLAKNFRHFGNNSYYTGLFLIIIYFSTISVGTNIFGGVSTGGMWFFLLGILLRCFYLSLSADPDREYSP